MNSNPKGTKRDRTGRRRTIRKIAQVCLLLDVKHPDYADKQHWYVEKVQKGVVEAVFIVEARHKRFWHSALIILPSNAPHEIRHSPGVAAALGVLEVELKRFKNGMLPMDDLTDRLWNVSHSAKPFGSKKWSPLIVTEDIPNTQKPGCWRTVSMWDDVVRTNNTLIAAVEAIQGSKPHMRFAKSRLRCLGLPTTEAAYHLHKLNLLSEEPEKL